MTKAPTFDHGVTPRAAGPAFRLRDPRYIKPRKYPSVPEYAVKFHNAKAMADAIEIPKDGERLYCLVPGNFIFGDLIEALAVKHNWLIKRLSVSTLSIGQENVDSMALLMEKGYLEAVDLIVSDYFFAHERRNVHYIYEQLDKNSSLQLAVAGIHTKVYLIELDNGQKLTIHGSINMRACSSIEQFMIESDPSIFDFNREWMQAILSHYQTVNKSIRGTTLWQKVAAMEGRERAEPTAKRPARQRCADHSQPHAALAA